MEILLILFERIRFPHLQHALQNYKPSIYWRPHRWKTSWSRFLEDITGDAPDPTSGWHTLSTNGLYKSKLRWYQRLASRPEKCSYRGNIWSNLCACLAAPPKNSVSDSSSLRMETIFELDLKYHKLSAWQTIRIYWYLQLGTQFWIIIYIFRLQFILIIFFPSPIFSINKIFYASAFYKLFGWRLYFF